jgi:hypothetical protein
MCFDVLQRLDWHDGLQHHALFSCEQRLYDAVPSAYILHGNKGVYRCQRR